MQAVREQLRDLDFEEEFVERILKDYSTKKIDEKLDLLMERKNIQNPAGWLRSALKNDYRDEEQESRPIPHPHLNPPPSRGRRDEGLEGEGQGEGDKILSTEEARERFHFLRQKLKAMG